MDSPHRQCILCGNRATELCSTFGESNVCDHDFDLCCLFIIEICLSVSYCHTAFDVNPCIARLKMRSWSSSLVLKPVLEA